jgi:hypothetical protein
MIAAWPAFSILIGIFLADGIGSAGRRFAGFLFTLFGWTGTVGSVMIFSSILLKGRIQIPFMRIREAVDIIPSTIYALSGAALLLAAFYVAVAVTKRIRSDTPFYYGLALVLFFLIYSIQQAAEPKKLVDAVYQRFGRDVRQYLSEKNHEGE